MSIDIVLINPLDPNSIDSKLDPPIGLMYIAAILEKNDFNVKIVDLAFIPKEKWKYEIGCADFYGISIFSPSLYLSEEIAKMCKEINPKGLVIGGGAHATILDHDLLKNKNFDIAVRNEGEYPTLEIVSGNPLNQIKGITYRNSEGKIIRNPKRELIKNLDELPFPARHLVPLKKYTRTVDGELGTSIIHSRGCPFNCAYCCNIIFGPKIRYRSSENLRAEINEIKEKYEIKNFVFYDDIVNITSEKLREFCKIVEPLDIYFKVAARPGLSNYEDFKLLKSVGCKEIAFGIESGDQRILNNLRKGSTVELNKKSIMYAKKAGLIVKAYLMLGSPGESWESVENTIKFMKETQPDQYTLFNFIPQPGCDIYNNPEKYGIKIINPDLKEFFYIGGTNIGGHPIATEFMSAKELAKARLYVLKEIGKPKGRIQKYYDELEEKGIYKK